MTEIVLACAIAISLVLLGCFFLVREETHRRRNHDYRYHPARECRYYRALYSRRTIGSVLLIAIGVAIFVGVLVFDFRTQPKYFAWCWLGIMLGVLVLLTLACWDIISIRQFARIQQKQLLDDRRALIYRELEKLQQEPPEPSSGQEWSPEHN